MFMWENSTHHGYKLVAFICGYQHSIYSFGISPTTNPHPRNTETNASRGSRVKCSVCGSSWYQSRERLFDIPTDTHNMIPSDPAELGRIARNMARDVSPNFQGVGKLYVGNLDWRTTPDELLDFFESNARKQSDESKPVEVCDVSIVMGQDGRSRGFAFVSFYDESDGKAALACNGLECNGRELAVREPNN